MRGLARLVPGARALKTGLLPGGISSSIVPRIIMARAPGRAPVSSSRMCTYTEVKMDQRQTICHQSFLNGALGLSKLTEKYLTSADGSEYIRNRTVLDIGSGKGNLVGHVIDNSARRVLGIDISGEAVKNCQKKFAGDKRVEFARIDVNNRTAVSKFIQRAAPAGVDTFLCNPAQIPLAAPLENGYFVGNDGRSMVDVVLREFAAVGLPRAVLIMTQTQLSGWKTTMEWCKSHGLCATVVAGSSFPVYANIQTNDDAMTYLHKRFGFEKKSSLEGYLLLIRHAAASSKYSTEVDKLGERKDGRASLKVTKLSS